MGETGRGWRRTAVVVASVAALIGSGVLVGDLGAAAVTGRAERPASAASAWIATWSGDVTASPVPTCVKAKPTCPNPFEVVVSITSATGGTVKYAGWDCAGTLAISPNSTGTALQVVVTITDPGPYDCQDAAGTFTSIGPGYADWDVANAAGQSEDFTGVLTTPAVPPSCEGSGSCGVSSSDPQVVCLTAATCPAGGVLTSTVSVAAFTNGATAPNTPVTVTFLSTSGATSSGSWCQGANGRQKTGRTNSQGLFQFSYTTAGLNVPTTPSFCMMRVTIGHSTVIEAIDQTNDPAPYEVTGSPKKVTRAAVSSAHARFALTVKKRTSHPGYVYGDPTTFYTEIPSIPGACGSFTPLVRKTAHPNGKATLVYSPSTVWAKRNKAYCTLIGQEADTGATSNKVVVYQKK